MPTTAESLRRIAELRDAGHTPATALATAMQEIRVAAARARGDQPDQTPVHTGRPDRT